MVANISIISRSVQKRQLAFWTFTFLEVRWRMSLFAWTKGGPYIQCIFAHLMHDWNQHRHGSILVSNTCVVQHAFFCAVSTDPNTNNQCWCTNGLLMVTQTQGAHYTYRIFARFMHMWARDMHTPQLYGPTFGSEPVSGLAQSSTADQPWMAHGGNTVRPFKWSHIYSRWDVSKNVQNIKFWRPLYVESWNLDSPSSVFSITYEISNNFSNQELKCDRRKNLEI